MHRLNYVDALAQTRSLSYEHSFILISLALHYLIINLCFVSRSMTLFSIFISGIYPICTVQHVAGISVVVCSDQKRVHASPGRVMPSLSWWSFSFSSSATFHIEIRAGNHYNWSCVFIIIFFFFFVYCFSSTKNRHQIARKHFNYCLQMANGWLNWTTLWRLAHSWEWVSVSVSVPFGWGDRLSRPVIDLAKNRWQLNYICHGHRWNRLEIGTLAKLIVVIVFV